MARRGMMDPRYAKAIKSTEELFTPIELQQMGIDPKNMIKTTSCNPYFETNYQDKNKLKNTFIKNSDAGLYEFFAKEVQCSQDFINQKRRLKESFGKTKGFYTEEQKKEQIRKLVTYEKDMDLLFRNLSRICQNKAKGLCGIRDKKNDVYTSDNLKQLMIDEQGGIYITDEKLQEIEDAIKGLNKEQIIEKIKTMNPRFKELLKMSDEDLGSGRKMLLMINGFEKVGQDWKYSKELEDKFVKAASICRSNNLCVKTNFADIPTEIGRFTEEILGGIVEPYDVMYSKAMKMFQVSKKKFIESQEKKEQDLDTKIQRLSKEKEELESQRTKEEQKLEDPNASKPDKIKAQALVDTIKKREKRINEGTSTKASLVKLQLQREKAKSEIKKKELEKTRTEEKEKSPYSFIRNRGTKTEKQKSSQQARQEKFKQIENEKRRAQLNILKAQNKDVGLTSSQAKIRDSKEYKLNPNQASSLERFRAQEGQKELKKLKKNQGQLTQTQKDRMKVLEKGNFRTSSVNKLTKKTETKHEKGERLEGERYNLSTKLVKGTLTPSEKKKLNRINEGTWRKSSLGKLQGKTKLNRDLTRKQDELNALEARKTHSGEKVNYSNKELKRMDKLQRNIPRLETKKKQRNNLLEKQKQRDLTFGERSNLRKLEGTRFISKKSPQKKQREQKAAESRLELLQQKQLRGEKLSSSNKKNLYGKKSLYRKSGLNKKKAQDAKLNHLNKALREREASFDKSDKKKYRKLQTKKLKREGYKNKNTRKLERKSREYEALKAREERGLLNNYSKKRLKDLENGTRFQKSITELAKKQAQRNIKKTKKNVIQSVEKQRLLESNDV